MTHQIQQVMEAAIQKRAPLIQTPYQTAFRLINGFLENLPHIIVDVFAKTVVFHDYTPDAELVDHLVPLIRKSLPWVKTGVIKKRHRKQSKHPACFVPVHPNCQYKKIKTLRKLIKNIGGRCRATLSLCASAFTAFFLMSTPYPGTTRLIVLNIRSSLNFKTHQTIILE